MAVAAIDPKLALAAEQGDAKSQFELGVTYYSPGPDQDFPKALFWLSKASEQGHARATYELAIMYIRGEGTPPDLQKARALLELAVNQGEVLAYYDLGVIYLLGEGVEANPQKADAYFNKGAGYGDARSHYVLGLLWAGNYNHAVDVSQAIVHLDAACKSRFVKACDALITAFSNEQSQFYDPITAQAYVFMKQHWESLSPQSEGLGAVYANNPKLSPEDNQKAYDLFILLLNDTAQ